MNKQELVAGLRFCVSTDRCTNCPIYEKCIEGHENLMLQSANVIETHMWISVKERLPENDQAVLAYTQSGIIDIGYYFNSGYWETLSVRSSNVTHWTYLPEPPEVIDL